MKTKENSQNSGSTVDILEAALKDADSNINILSREKLELLEQIEKIKTKFEVADILVEKSRQLELATAAEVEADRATKEAKVQELEARLQTGALEYRKLAVSKRNQDLEIQQLKEEISTLQAKIEDRRDPGLPGDMSRYLSSDTLVSGPSSLVSSVGTTSSDVSNNLFSSIKIETELQSVQNPPPVNHNQVKHPALGQVMESFIGSIGEPLAKLFVQGEDAFLIDSTPADPYCELNEVLRRRDYNALLRILQSPEAGLTDVLAENVKKYRLVLASEAKERMEQFTQAEVQTFITRTNVLIALENVKEHVEQRNLAEFEKALRRKELGLVGLIQEEKVAAYLDALHLHVQGLGSSDILKKVVIKQTLESINSTIKVGDLPPPLEPEIVDGIPEIRSRSPARYSLSSVSDLASGATFHEGAAREPTQCPVCDMNIQGPDTDKRLMNHMETHMNHLETHMQLECPMCPTKYSQLKQKEFESHVHTHFINEGGLEWDLGID